MGREPMIARLSRRWVTQGARLAVPILAAALVLLALPVVTGAAHAAPAAMTGPVVLNGEGTLDIPPDQLTGWYNDLYGSPNSPHISLGYIPLGGPQGLGDLLSGLADFAVSGVPYTSSELASYPGGASGIIAAPVMASATGFMLDPPPSGFNINFTTQYTGQVRVPADNLIAQLFNYTSTPQTFSPSDPLFPAQCPPNPSYSPGQLDYAEWDSPAILGEWDRSFSSQYNPANGDIFYPCGQPYVQPVYEAESNESTYYMELWASEAAPDMWSLLRAVNGTSTTNPWEPSGQIQSRLQKSIIFQPGPGLQQSLDSFVTASTFEGGPDTGGMEEAVPPSGLLQAKAACLLEAGTTHCKLQAPPFNFQWVYIQNANGDWVAPTPDSIDAAVNAMPLVTPTATTDEPPLYAATTKVPGAYPLTYIDYMYVPAHGEYDPSNPTQSTAKIEALATVMRYLATTAQGTMAQYNDGVLSSALQEQALAAANQFVQNNCPAADITYLSLNDEYHCGTPITPPPGTTTTTTAVNSTTTQPGSAPTTSAVTSRTTTTPPTTGVSSGGLGSSGGAGSGGSSSALSSGRSSTSPAGSAAAASGTGPPGSAGSGGGTAVSNAASYASGLPFLRNSGTESGLDKLVALIVGVWLFLLVRRWPLRWLRRALGS
jgi:hypothetical protein